MAAPPSITVLIADDEPLARQRLVDLVGREADLEVVGVAQNGPEAVDAIQKLEPDLVFLDVQMPGLSGIEVVRAVGVDAMPCTIFVTAYDDYALRAFDLAALDYLLKPFDDERFEQSVARARKLLGLRVVSELTDRLVMLLESQRPGRGNSQAERKGPSTSYLERIAVEMRGQIRVVPVEKIQFIAASGPYAVLHAGSDRYLVRERMQTLEERLDPDAFFRIHRSTIVRLEEVEALLNHGGGDYEVRLRSGKHLSVSRNRREALERHLGLGALRPGLDS